MQFEFSGSVIEWRGPAPFYFVEMPAAESDDLKAMAASLSYGWGCIPATVRINSQEWSTALMPRNGTYLVPLRKAYRLALDLHEGQQVRVSLTL